MLLPEPLLELLALLLLLLLLAPPRPSVPPLPFHEASGDLAPSFPVCFTPCLPACLQPRLAASSSRLATPCRRASPCTQTCAIPISTDTLAVVSTCRAPAASTAAPPPALDAVGAVDDAEAGTGAAPVAVKARWAHTTCSATTHPSARPCSPINTRASRRVC